jgi:hypothetical protein
MTNKITLPTVPNTESGWIGLQPHELRARDLEVARLVLEAAAQAAELWHARGIEVEIARDIRNLKVSHD